VCRVGCGVEYVDVGVGIRHHGKHAAGGTTQQICSRLRAAGACGLLYSSFVCVCVRVCVGLLSSILRACWVCKSKLAPYLRVCAT